MKFLTFQTFLTERTLNQRWMRWDTKCLKKHGEIQEKFKKVPQTPTTTKKFLLGPLYTEGRRSKS